MTSYIDLEVGSIEAFPPLLHYFLENILINVCSL